MMQAERGAAVGTSFCIFGAHSFMNIFMGGVLRTHVTVHQGSQLPGNKTLEEELHGCPVGFALAAFQQAISFFCF